MKLYQAVILIVALVGCILLIWLLGWKSINFTYAFPVVFLLLGLKDIISARQKALGRQDVFVYYRWQISLIFGIVEIIVGVFYCLNMLHIVE